MGIFNKLYSRVKDLAGHERAPRYLAAYCFFESSLFIPVPPDVMLGPMCMSKPAHSYRYAYIAISFSVLGAILGYLIGYVAFDTIVQPLIKFFNYQHHYEIALLWFSVWGFWSIIFAGFTPVPFILFTVGSGVMGYSLPLFILAAIIGRSARFLLVSSLVKFGVMKIETQIEKRIDLIGWLVVLFTLIFFGIKFLINSKLL